MTIALHRQGSPRTTEEQEPLYKASQELSGNPAYGSHFSSSWVALSDEDAEQPRPSIPTQRPDQTPLPTLPSPGAATTSSQYLTYFPDSWIASLSSPPSPSSSRTSVTTAPLESPSSVVTARRNFRLSRTTLWPNSSIPSTARRRNTLWAHRIKDWMTGLRNSVMVQFSPLLKQERPIAQEEKNTSSQSQHTDPRSVPSWMQRQEDLQGLELNNTDCKVDHATNDKVDYLEGIEEDDSHEGYGDIPHRAPSVAIAYSGCASSTQ